MALLRLAASAALLAAPAAASMWGKPLRFRADVSAGVAAARGASIITVGALSLSHLRSPLLCGASACAQGTFKIVEVSDVHHTGNLFCTDISKAQQAYPCSDANGTAFFQQAIRDEDPDVFVFTGDNVCGGDVFGGQNALDGLLKDFVSASNTVPWLAVEGAVPACGRPRSLLLRLIVPALPSRSLSSPPSPSSPPPSLSSPRQPRWRVRPQLQAGRRLPAHAAQRPQRAQPEQRQRQRRAHLRQHELLARRAYATSGLRSRPCCVSLTRARARRASATSGLCLRP